MNRAAMISINRNDQSEFIFGLVFAETTSHFCVRGQSLGNGNGVALLPFEEWFAKDSKCVKTRLEHIDL